MELASLGAGACGAIAVDAPVTLEDDEGCASAEVPAGS